MSEIDQLAAALVSAQAEFSAVPKTSDNPFFRSKYADIATVVSHAQPILAKHGLAVSQHPTVVDGEPSLTTYLIHSSGQFISSTMKLCAAKMDPQGQGAAITYARRFAYQAVLGLVADEDDDGNAASSAPVAKTYKATVKKPPPSSALDVAKSHLRAAIKSSGANASDYSWVASATDSDVDKIEGLASALELGKVSQ
jgi:hypothetical protein